MSSKTNHSNMRIVFPLALIFAFRMFGLFTILPVFAIYARDLNAVTPFLIGIALGIYGLTQGIFQIPFGLLSDQYGRKTMILVGLFLFCLGSVVSALSGNIYGIIAGRCLQGMGAVGSVIMALAADLTPEKDQFRAMAIIGMTIGVSFVLAMGIGPLLNSWIGVPGIFWLTALLTLLGMIILVFWVPPPKDAAKDHATLPTKKLIVEVILDRKLTFSFAGVLILHASLTALFLKIPIAIMQLGVSRESLWRFYLPVFLGSILTTALIILWSDRQKITLQTLKPWIFLLFGSVVIIAAFFDSYIGLTIGMFLFFTAFNLLEASLPANITVHAKKECRGTALGVYSSLQFLGLFLGGLIGGFLDSQYGIIAVFGFCVILALIWSVWVLESTKWRFNKWQED